MEDMVMRSVYLRPSEDGLLRQLAHELHVTKSDLIRSAIGVKLREWLDSKDTALVMRDLAVGRRDQAQDGAERSEKVEPLPNAVVEVVEAGHRETVAPKAKTGSRSRVAANI